MSRACLFGTYARSHSASRALRMALAAAGFEVGECHVPLWEETRDKTAAYFSPRSLAGLAARYTAAARELAGRWRRERLAEAGLVVCGFGGQLDVILARLLGGRAVRLVFAPLVTISETLVDDRRVYGEGSWRARAVRVLDRLTLRLADLVLIDTDAHGRFLVAEFGVDPERVATLYLGAEPAFIAPAGAPRPAAQRVLFYGQYLPLHGVETIARAIGKLASADVEWVLVGTGAERERAERLIGGLARREKVSLVDWVPYAELPRLIREATVCLGAFGTSRKARMVIPSKVYQAAAGARPVVTADTAAVREVFEPGQTICLCPPGDADALAATVEGLLADRARAARIGEAARALVAERLTPEAQGARLAGLLAARFGGI